MQCILLDLRAYFVSSSTCHFNVLLCSFRTAQTYALKPMAVSFTNKGYFSLLLLAVCDVHYCSVLMQGA